MQDIVLALLAKEPSHGYKLRARLQEALGPLGDGMNAGQVYVTLTRLEKAGLVTAQRVPGESDRPDRKVHAVTAAGQRRVADWLTETNWPRTAPTEFHLKLVVAASAGLADPVAIVRSQRRVLMQSLRDAQDAALAEGDEAEAQLLLEGVVLRLRADLAWLDACERYWSAQK